MPRECPGSRLPRTVLALPPGVAYHPVPGCPGYVIGADRRVWHKTTRPAAGARDERCWRCLKSVVFSGVICVRLYLDGQELTRSVETLWRCASDPDPSRWAARIRRRLPRAGRMLVPSQTQPDAQVDIRPIPGFEGYRLGSDRSVWTCVNRGRLGDKPRIGDPPVWRRMAPVRGGKAQLTRDGERFVFSLDRLYREVFPDRAGPGSCPPPPAPPELAHPATGPVPDPPCPEPPASAPAPPPLPEIRPVPGFEGYGVARDRSVWTCRARTFGGTVIGNPPVWRRVALHTWGGRSPRAQLRRDGRLFSIAPEKLYRMTFEPPPPPRPQPQPLPLGGHLGEVAVGSANGRARLTEELVAEARRLHREGWSYAALRERYGIGRVTLHYALVGKTWGHVPMPS